MMKEPDRIIKKTVLNGQTRYQVKWKGFEEPTWETEESIKKHRELIEDYNYFSLTGDRYDDKKLEELRQFNAQSQPRTAIKRVAPPKPSPQPETIKKDKKIDKFEQKSIEICEIIKKPDQSHSYQIVQQQSNQQQFLNQQFTLQQTNQQQIIQQPIQIDREKSQESQQKQNQKQSKVQSPQNVDNIINNNIIRQKQQELQKKEIQSQANEKDQVDTIKLQIANDKCVFVIQWKQRQDGLVPLPQYFSYEQFKIQAPLFYIQFMETSIFESQSNTEIKFELYGNNVQEKIAYINSLLQKEAEQVKQKEKQNEYIQIN